MCTCHFPDDIIVCPHCKRDDEGFKIALSDSPFENLGDGRLRCACGYVFSPADNFSPLQLADRGKSISRSRHGRLTRTLRD